jgi:pantoate--beta-alanine ligase
MQLITSLPDFRAIRQALSPTLRIGLVPTMGALHEGHASLVRRSVEENDFTIVTIFVNPTQFGPQEDFSRYPRTLEADASLLAALGADLVFAPNVADIYPGQSHISFNIRQLDAGLCGASRPGHMNGVLQIVAILFHLTQPHRAYFGRKDYQQFLIIQQMVTDLHFPLEVIPCPILREADGLAMSSRNVYLNPEERKQALFLSQTLRYFRQQREHFDSVAAMRRYLQQTLRKYPLVRLDYFAVMDGRTLQPVESLDPAAHPHAFLAAYLGRTRLIDNLPLSGEVKDSLV